MVYIKSQKIPTFDCEKCYYLTSSKKDFSKHLETIKHKKRTNVDKMLTDVDKMLTNNCVFEEKSPKQYQCECGKFYKYRQSLSVHRKKCDFKNEKIENSENNEIIIKNNEKNDEDILEKVTKIIEKNNECYKELILKVVEQQTKVITDLIPKIGNNNNSNNTINQKLNINLFLNEQCKDAISLNDFIKNIEVSVNDLLLSKEKGLVKGISNLFIKHLNELPMIQRPLWCSDKKRKKIYVKEDTWVEDVDNNKTKDAIYNISKVQSRNMNKYIYDKPNWKESDKDKEIYMDIVKNVTDAVDDNKKNKVIESIIDTIHLTDDVLV